MLPPLAAEDHVCPDCGLDYQQVRIEDAVAAITRVPAEAREAVAAIPESVLRWRPSAGTWSVTEYVRHLRDVYATYTIRLHRARTEDRPVLEPMLSDLRARRFGDNELDLERMANS